MGILKIGDIVKLKHALFFSGWKGFGVVIEDQFINSDLIVFIKLQNENSRYDFLKKCTCVRNEVVKTQKPSKNVIKQANNVLLDMKNKEKK